MKSTFGNLKVLGILSLPLAAIALAVILLSGSMSFGRSAHAAGAETVSLSTGACESNQQSTPKCSVGGGSTFTVAFNIKKFAGTGWDGYDVKVGWTGAINFKSGTLVRPAQIGPGPCSKTFPGTTACFYSDINVGGQPVGTPKGTTPQETGNGTMSAGGAQSIQPDDPDNGTRPSSTYLGQILTFNMVCKSTGTGTITLIHGAGQTDILPGPQTEAADESITINCVPVTATFTPTPTATPPPVPKVQKTCTSVNVAGPSTLCNVFLHRQGAKIPPTTCLASTDVATLTEAINVPITTINPKGEAQTLAAFEFEVRYDAKNVCVELNPATNWSSDANVICTIRDDTNSTIKGIAQIGCVTSGKGHKPTGLTLATIKVHASPELYSQIRPNQDNGIPVQLLNQGCNLADEQGHAIPIFSCEDADITFRYLEGDVDGPDCDVDLFDTQAVSFRWGVHKGSLLYNSFMDLEPSGQIKGNGAIDIKDVQFVFGRFNSTCATPWPAQLPVNPKA